MSILGFAPKKEEMSFNPLFAVKPKFAGMKWVPLMTPNSAYDGPHINGPGGTYIIGDIMIFKSETNTTYGFKIKSIK